MIIKHGLRITGESMKGWFYDPKPKDVPEEIRAEIESKARNLIEFKLKKEHIKGKNPTNDYNYIADIYFKWIGNRFYLCSKYNCPSPRAISPSFESKFARLECISNNKFQLFFMRHTGQWINLYQDISLEKAFKAIMEDPYFRP